MILIFQRHLRLFCAVTMYPIAPLQEKPNLHSENLKIEKQKKQKYA